MAKITINENTLNSLISDSIKRHINEMAMPKQFSDDENLTEEILQNYVMHHLSWCAKCVRNITTRFFGEDSSSDYKLASLAMELVEEYGQYVEEGEYSNDIWGVQDFFEMAIESDSGEEF